ncbi:MAG TPA: T9SS type A sorting domain-containing protein [Chitinophagaceae bacterium]|nr:T9SS type A sorting domain-containing protein [Chitinophagaceae bacterium]
MSVFVAFNSTNAAAQGTWRAIKKLAPLYGEMHMVLLSDGTVLCRSQGNGGYGKQYCRLTPDSTGSYVNGSWSVIAPMNNSREYYASQLLKDGRLYVGGGYYGNGGDSLSEIYDPLTNIWTRTGSVGTIMSQGSTILENGTIIQELYDRHSTRIYDPATNSYRWGPYSSLPLFDAWVKLPDNSILTAYSTSSVRYIPSLNEWITDASIPVDLADDFGYAQGAGLLLPNGKAIFFGSSGHTAIYTPSGNSSPGKWTAGADFPDGNAAVSAPAVLLNNGNVLCTTSPIPEDDVDYNYSPITFYIYNYRTNSFKSVDGPGNFPLVYPGINFINLPNGQVLFCSFSNQYDVFIPDGKPIASGAPVLNAITKVNDSVYIATGTGFNGLSEASNHGFDWQLNTNYPLVRFNSNAGTFYGRTFNWNSTGVQRGNLTDTTYLTLPRHLRNGKYHVCVVANGIKSNSLYLKIQNGIIVNEAENMGAEDSKSLQKISVEKLSLYPNPATTFTTVSFYASGHFVLNLSDEKGNILQTKNITAAKGLNTITFDVNSYAAGLYFVTLIDENKNTRTLKLTRY